jgi:hypothetical protein
MRAAPPTSLLLLFALAATPAGCSNAPGARAWAASVCTVLSPWRFEIGSLAVRTQQQMTAATMPAQAQENLTRLFSGAESASERARAGVARAGVPDADHGKHVAASFTASLTGMRDAYRRARTGIAALATTPAGAFYGHVAAVVDRLNAEYAQSELDTSKIDATELKEAFDEVRECR